MLGLVLSIEEADVNKSDKKPCCLGVYILGGGSSFGGWGGREVMFNEI